MSGGKVGDEAWEKLCEVIIKDSDRLLVKLIVLSFSHQENK